MAESELTPEDREHLHKMSAIALMLVFSAIMLYFIYLMNTNPLKTLWDLIVWVGLPSAVGMPTAFFLTFEVLYRRRVKNRIQFHLRRFAGNMLVPVVGILSLLSVQGIFFVLFSTALSERRAVLLGTGLWVLMFLTVVFKLRKRHLQKVLERS